LEVAEHRKTSAVAEIRGTRSTVFAAKPRPLGSPRHRKRFPGVYKSRVFAPRAEIRGNTKGKQCGARLVERVETNKGSWLKRTVVFLGQIIGVHRCAGSVGDFGNPRRIGSVAVAR
jgi:hypothetical protein